MHYRPASSFRRVLLLLIASLIAGASTLAFAADAPAQVEDPPAINYRVVIDGEVDGATAKRLRRVSQAVALVKRPPPTVGLLERRAEADTERLLQAMRSYGYYSATVDYAVDEATSPVTLRYTVQSGPAYVVRELTFDYATGAPPLGLGVAPKLTVQVGEVFVAAAVPVSREALLRWMRIRGFPQPRIADQQIRVEHSDHSVHVQWTLEPGPRAQFGATVFEGMERVEQAWLERVIPWQPGDRYDIRRIETLRDALSAANLFTSIQLDTAVREHGDGESAQVDVLVVLHEGPPRTVRASVGYNSDEGPYINGGWEHRNLLGQAEIFNVDARLSLEALEGGAEFRKPGFRRPDQDLILTIRGARQDFDPYVSETVRLSAGIERRLTPIWTLRLESALRVANVTQADEREIFALLSFPASLVRDSRDDRLHPTRGSRWSLTVEPTTDLAGSLAAYVTGTTEYRRYWRISDDPEWLVAGRFKLGSISGADHDSVPADARFYGGGGSSIRGYGFQEVGPFEGSTNVGGLSLLEASAELRWRINERFGAVAFVDAGNAYLERYPDLSEPLQVGAGLGFRYFTAFGPIRLDVAVPLNPQEQHGPFQFYISIGQAF